MLIVQFSQLCSWVTEFFFCSLQGAKFQKTSRNIYHIKSRDVFDMFYVSKYHKSFLQAYNDNMINSCNSYRNSTNDDTISNNNSNQQCNNSSGGSYNSIDNFNNSCKNIVKVIV